MTVVWVVKKNFRRQNRPAARFSGEHIDDPGRQSDAHKPSFESCYKQQGAVLLIGSRLPCD